MVTTGRTEPRSIGAQDAPFIRPAWPVEAPRPAPRSDGADLALFVVFGLFVWAEIVFLTVVAFGLTVGLSKYTDWYVYIVAWAVGLPAAVASVWALQRLQARLHHPLLAPLLSGGLVLAAVAAGTSAVASRLSAPQVDLVGMIAMLNAPVPTAVTFTPWLLILGLAGPAWTALVLVLLARFGTQLRQPGLVRFVRAISFVVVPLGLTLPLLAWVPADVAIQPLLGRMALAGVMLPALAVVARFLPAPRPAVRWLLDGALLLGVLVVALALIFDPRLPTEALHQSFYLGPVSAVLAGKSVLVDVNSYYGVLIIYALAAALPLITLPLSYAAFTLLNTLLIGAQFVLMAFVVRRLTGSILATAGMMAIVLAVALTEAYSNLLWHAQNGPLRFGLPYVMLALLALDDRPGWRRRWVQAAQLVLLGIAALWSIETFAYIAACYGAALVYGAWTSAPNLRGRIRDLLQRLRAPVAAVVAAHMLFALATWARSGAWPDWRLYWALILVNSPGSDLGVTRMRPWDPWPFVMLAFAASILAVVARHLFWPGAADRRERVAFALTAFGVLQFTYYLYRPVPASLLGCAVVATMLAAYWVVRTWRSQLPAALRLAAMACAGTLLVGASLAYPTTLERRYEEILLPHTLPLVSGALRGQSDAVEPFVLRVRGASTSPPVVETRDLILRHQPGAQRVAAFLLTGTVTYEVLSAARAGHVFPLSQPVEDALAPQTAQRAIDFEQGLQPGDVIFVDPLTVNPLQRQIVRRLCDEFDFEVLETTRLGVAALRLRAPGSPGGGVWCAAHFVPFLQGSDGTVYATDLGTRRRMPDQATYQRYAGVRPSVAETRRLDDGDLARIPEGAPLASVAAGPVFVSDLMYAYQVTDDGQLLRLPDACTAEVRGVQRDAGNLLVVLDDLDRFTTAPGLRFFGGVLGDPRTATMMRDYSTAPGAERVTDLSGTSLVQTLPREKPAVAPDDGPCAPPPGSR